MTGRTVLQTVAQKPTAQVLKHVLAYFDINKWYPVLQSLLVYCCFFLHFYTFMIVTYYLVIVLLTLTLEDF